MPQKKEIHRKFDCHMHTWLCGHAIGTPTDYVDTARRRGLSMITFTCHIPMPGDGFSQKGIRMNRGDLPLYRELVEEARDYGASHGIEVLHGIEAEIFPDPEIMEEMSELIEDEAFDFVLGSLHHMLPAWRRWMESEGHSTDVDKIRAYFEQLAAGAASGRYHSIAHPDVIRIYSTLEGRFHPSEHEPVIKDCLDTVANSGVCLEINTSGLTKGDYVVHPDPLIMRWALERNIPFTIGSDSHLPERVGDAFPEVLEEFKDLGLEKLHYFKAGQRVSVSI